MQLKKVYLEITNVCNLKCSFCIKNQRKIKAISKDEYIHIIDKIKDYTQEIYLHILGEPLMHQDINYFIDYASENNLLVNITTNGYLIKNIANNQNIHRLNISLHSYNEIYGKSLEQYLDDIFYVIDKLKKQTFITLRLWVNSENTKKIITIINKKYAQNIENITKNTKIKMANNLIIDTFHEFIWPDLTNDYYCETGTCKGLIDHFGILSDGTIVPCCLDSKGIINLGNIYKDNLSNIFASKRVKNMITGFKNHQKYEELCKHCHFLEK